MEEPGTIYFTGTAGAGKSSLVRSFHEWARGHGLDTAVVNLDPGVENPPYEPDVDIREWVRLRDVMDEYDLGPNGAQVAAADMIALKVFDVKQALAEFKSDYVLIDTPGQIELFAFREASKAIVDALSGDRSTIAFLFDPALSRTPAGFISLLMLSATVEFRFRLPTVNALTKTDVLKPDELDQIIGWGEEPHRLYDAAILDGPGTDVGLTTELFRALESTGPLSSLIATSAKDGVGLEQLYRALQQNFAGAEDLEPSQGPTD